MNACIKISLTALKDLSDNTLFSTNINDAYRVIGGKLSSTHFLSDCILDVAGTQSSASSVVWLKSFMPIPNRPHTAKHIIMVRIG